MENGYGLYQTLNDNIPSAGLKKAQRTELWNKLKDIEDYRTREAVFMLIYEHYRLSSDEEPNSALPYNGRKRTKGVEFCLENFPQDLQWILYKFFSFTQ